MLKKLKTHKLVDEQDRIKYASGSLSLTIWFDANAEIFAFEVIFDLLLNEKCFFTPEILVLGIQKSLMII